MRLHGIDQHQFLYFSLKNCPQLHSHHSAHRCQTKKSHILPTLPSYQQVAIALGSGANVSTIVMAYHRRNVPLHAIQIACNKLQKLKSPVCSARFEKQNLDSKCMREAITMRRKFLRCYVHGWLLYCQESCTRAPWCNCL
jgi:hypothetical protein